MHRPRRKLGGSRAPSFLVPRCTHYRSLGRSAHRVLPRQWNNPEGWRWDRPRRPGRAASAVLDPRRRGPM